MKPVAIIASSFRLPRDLASLDDIAAALAAKKSQISPIGNDRWNHDLNYHPDRARQGYTYANHAGLIEGDPQAFDPLPFGVNRREAAQMDPQQKLLLELTHEAVGQTIYSRQALEGRDIGVFMGVSSIDAGFLYGQDPLAGDSYFMTGTTQSLVSNRISHVFGWNGPNTPVDTACSSSLVAIDAGLKSLDSGETEMVLIGGVSILLNAMSFVGFAGANMLSATGECHVFDQAADGYTRGEGAGVALLKPLDAALRDGDPIQAIIRSAGISHNGHNNLVSFPKREAQAKLIAEQMEKAGVGPEDFAYYEAHGTGTPVGDPAEAWAIGNAVGTGRSSPVPIGSVKGNVGHLEPASGMAGLGKVLASFRSNQLLPQANFKNPSEGIAFDDWNIRVVNEATPEDFSKRRIIGLNSFGFGGVNGSMVLEAPGVHARPRYVPGAVPTGELESRLVVAAWSDDALATRCEQADALAQKGVDPRLAATLAMRLEDAPKRAVRLRADGQWISQNVVAPDTGLGPVLVFSGNGSQRPGMGRFALQTDPIFKQAFAKVAAILEPELGFDPLDALLNEDTSVDLEDTSISQPLLFALQAAYVERMAADGIQPGAVIGHSVGEVGAAYAAGALDLEAACQVVVARSAAQNTTRGDGRMFAVLTGAANLNADDLRVRFDAHIAGLNSHKVTAVTVLGEADGFAAEMETRGIRAIDIGIDYPFHSPGMEPVQAPLAALLEGLEAKAPKIPLFSTMTGAKWTGGEMGPAYWWDNVREPVSFDSAVNAALDAGHRHFIEVGPQPILVRHLNDVAQKAEIEIATAPIDAIADARKDNADPQTLEARIANIWAMGVKTDMAMFIGTEPKIDPAIELPAYPYAREHHGFSLTDDGPIWRTAQRAHPLLGDRRPPAHAFRNQIDHLRYPFLADHQVQNRVLFPGAGTMELMLSAARIFAGGDMDAPIRLTDFALMRPMELSPEECTSVETRWDETSGAMSVLIRPAVQLGPFRPHATATVLPGLPSAAGAWVLPQVGADSDVLAKGQLYALTEALDLQYGPHFRCVDQVATLDERTVVAELSYPGDPLDNERSTDHGLAFHPGLLDGAFQAALALLASGDGDAGTFVPQGAETIHFFGNEAASRRVTVTLHHASEESVVADIALFAEDGAPLVAIERLRLMPMPSAGRPTITRETLLAPRWLPVEPLQRPADDLLGQPQGSPLDGLASRIVSHGLQTIGQASGLEAGLFSLDQALEQNLITEDNAEAAASLLVELDFEPTEDDGVLSLSGESSVDDLRAAWRTAAAAHPDRGAELSLLAHRIEATPDILAGKDAAIAAEAQLVDALRRGGADVGLGGRLAASILSALEGSPKRARLRFSGGRMTIVIGQVLGTLRRARPDQPLDVQIIVQDAEALVRAQSDLAGFSAIKIVLAEEIETLPPADLVVRMPDAVQDADEDATPDLSAEFFGCAAGTVVLDAGVPESITETFLLGLHGAMPNDIDASVWQLKSDRTTPVQAVQIMPTALPATLESTMALDVRNQNIGADSVANIQRIAQGLAGADAAQLTHFVLVTTLGDVAQEGLAAALGCVANEAGWPSFTHVAVDANTDPSGGLDALIARHGGENTVRVTRAGETVMRHLALDQTTSAPPPAERPVFTRRLRGVLEPVPREPAETPTPAKGEILLAAEASGLNFRDVMYAMRLLPAEALEDGFTGATIGMEAAGTVVAVGEGVTRFKPGDRAVAFASDAFASHVLAKEMASIALPDSLDMTSAATLLTSYVTAWYGLVDCARVKAGDLVLVQAGAGALGLAAIQVAQHLGCRVVATAGSGVKQAVVRATGAEFVTQSRDGSFAAVLEERYGRQKFACVLNSVSGAAVEDGISLLKPFGQFVEFGKRDFYENRPMFMKQLRRNITFHGVDTDQLLRYEPEMAGRILQELMERLQAGDLTPLLHEQTDVSLLGSVMADMQSSRHVGKLVLTHPPQTTRSSAVGGSSQKPQLVHGSGVPKEGAIAIIGGSAGFGFAAVERLARMGASAIYVITRRGKFDEEHAAKAAELTAETGCVLKAIAADASDAQQLAAAFDVIRKEAGSLTGIVQAALVLADGMAKDATLEDWQDVFQAKTNIDDAVAAATQDDDLQLFLVFSSATTMIGNPGQANYVAANRILEARVTERAASGKAGLAIGWGAIGNAGYLARNENVRGVLEKVIGQPALLTQQAMDLMEQVLEDESAPPVVFAMPANWGRMASRLPIASGLAFSPLVRHVAQGGGEEDGFLETLQAIEAGERVHALAQWLREKLADALRVDSDSLALNKPLSDMGLDSLLAVEFGSTIEAGLEITVDAGAVNADASLTALAEKLHERLFGEDGGAAAAGDSTVESLARLHLADGETASDEVLQAIKTD
ncbi:MAG: SDR family NAD(P)-dependent oxidoreductase [Pseudomonadota bacterium]